MWEAAINELMKKTPRRHATTTTSMAGLWQKRWNEIEVGRIYTSLATGMVVFATYIHVPWQWTGWGVGCFSDRVYHWLPWKFLRHLPSLCVFACMCAWQYVWFAVVYTLIKAWMCMFVCSCWISNYDVFYGAFCAPVGLILLFNLSMVLYIICSLSRRKKWGKGNSEKKQIYQLLRITVSLSVLLGITWLFGILVVLVDSLTFQYIFAILNTIQGFLIFIFHTIGSVEVRKEWSNTVNNIRRKRTTSLNFMSTEKTGTAKSGTSRKRPNDLDKSALLAEGVALSDTQSPWSESTKSVAERTFSVAAASTPEATELSVMDNRGAFQKPLEERDEAEMQLTRVTSLAFSNVQVNEKVWTWY